MEVIGAGWGRTGTLTIKTALEILGLPCYHMVNVLDSGGADAQQWLRAAQGEPVDLQALLSGYKACADWPTTSFYKQLMQLYPDAKVILTVRDPAKWYASAEATIWQIYKVLREAPFYVKLLSRLVLPTHASAMRDMVTALIWEGDLQGSFQDLQRTQQLFVEWNESVKQHVPADRLLIFEPKQGWEPLCAFLGKPIPDVPFPHVNDTDSFRQRVAAVKTRVQLMTYAVPAVAAALLAVGVAAAVRSQSRR